MAYTLKEWGNSVIGFKYLPPDTVRLFTKDPITREQRLYLACAVVDPHDAGVDGWMKGDITIIREGEDAAYPQGGELLVMLKDEKRKVYDCEGKTYVDDPGPHRKQH